MARAPAQRETREGATTAMGWCAVSVRAGRSAGWDWQLCGRQVAGPDSGTGKGSEGEHFTYTQ